LGLGIIVSIATWGTSSLRTDVLCCGVEVGSELLVNRASRPRPRPDLGLATSDYLLSECAISQTSRRCGIIIENGLSKARCLTQANIAVNDRFKHFFREVATHLAHYIASQTCTWIKHRQDHSIKRQITIEFIFDNVDRIDQLG